MNPEEWSALSLSFKTAATACLLLSGPGILTAWLMARYSFRFKTLVESILQLPLALPPVVIGYILLLSCGPETFIGNLFKKLSGIHLAFSFYAAVLASAVVAFPLMVQAFRVSLELVDPALEQAAKTLGTSPWKVFLRVTLPLALPGLSAGFILGFARALGEFGATITFAGNLADQTRTLPLAIYHFLQMPNGDHSAVRLVTISVLLSVSALLGARWFEHKMRLRLKGRAHA